MRKGAVKKGGLVSTHKPNTHTHTHNIHADIYTLTPHVERESLEGDDQSGVTALLLNLLEHRHKNIS